MVFESYRTLERGSIDSGPTAIAAEYGPLLQEPEYVWRREARLERRSTLVRAVAS
jgi:hypothetical protein